MSFLETELEEIYDSNRGKMLLVRKEAGLDKLRDIRR